MENKEVILDNPSETEHLEWQNMQANYSAMMYLITEQQALIAELLDQLLQKGVIDEPGLTKVTGVYGDPDKLNPVYDELYKRFATYFLKVKHVLENPDDYQPQSPFPNPKESKDD